MALLDRTAATLVLGFAGIALVGWLRPTEPAGSWDRQHPKRHWARKLEWRSDFDLVFAGDSRVVFGVAPEVASDALGGLRVANFGFLGGGFDADYLAAVERTLDPASPAPTIVLGVSPRSIVPTLTWVNEYTEARDLGLSERLTELGFAEFLWDYRRLDLEGLEDWLRGRAERDEVAYRFHDDGWIETRILDPERLSRQDRMNPISEPVAPYPPTMVAAVMDAVARWSAAGIRVYGYRSPTPAERAANEDQLYRFDEAAFRASFEASGGTWLDLPPRDWDYWDSSHMDDVSARAFTALFAEALRAHGGP